MYDLTNIAAGTQLSAPKKKQFNTTRTYSSSITAHGTQPLPALVVYLAKSSSPVPIT